MAMGQSPNGLAPSEHPNPTTKIGSKMGGAPTPKWYPIGLDNHKPTCWVTSHQSRCPKKTPRTGGPGYTAMDQKPVPSEQRKGLSGTGPWEKSPREIRAKGPRS